jgi:peptide methionine sulfoxide reductase MsrA
MSHYIVAEKRGMQNSPKLAELSYSGGSTYASIVYTALRSQECNADTSGNGDTLVYSQEEIKKAVEEIEKVSKFLKAIEHEKFVEIGWW